MQISQMMTSYTQPNFDQIWWKKISQPICIRNVWFFAVQFLTVLLPWQHTGFQTYPILKTFLATFSVQFHICKWCLVYMIQQAYQYVSFVVPLSVFLSWKSLTYWNQVGEDWKRVSCHGNRTFIATGVFLISLPSFNGLHCKLAKIALFIYLR